jgi:glycosyltransferase involved in cell wall biosynthesis
MTKQNIIFILPNIYESINGVSNKYIKFINYLNETDKFNIIIFSPFIESDKYEKIKSIFSDKNVQLIKTEGIRIPFYKEIKVPIINENELLSFIKDTTNIIIFNGEFFWLYDTLKKIKEEKNTVKIYPTWHTDYENYVQYFYFNPLSCVFNSIESSTSPCFLKSVINYIDCYCKNNIFHGLIVTGEHVKERFIKNTKNIFNAAELDLTIYNKLKFDSYKFSKNNPINIIYCGRISKEKNIDEFFECCLKIYGKYDFKIHIIGDGPELKNIKNKIKNTREKLHSLKNNIIFYGSKNSEEIMNLYFALDNRIFLFTSITETFGKSPMEACATGIVLFIKKSEASISLYEDNKTAFLFDNPDNFIDKFKFFLSNSDDEKKNMIKLNRKNIEQYNQQIVFDKWLSFLLEIKNIDNKTEPFLFDKFFIKSLSKFIICSQNLMDY